MTGLYIFLASALGIAAYFVYREIRNLKEALSSARAQIYLLKKDLVTSNATVVSYQLKLGELKDGAIVKFEKVGEEMTVDEAMAFMKDLTDDKN